MFQTGRSPGRLVRTEFQVARAAKGVVQTESLSGWAYVPNPAPSLSELGASVAPLMAPMEEAVAALARLDGFFHQSPGGFNIDPWVLFRPLRIREARLSSQIENTVASAAEVGLAETTEPDRSDAIEVRNYLRALDLAAVRKDLMSEAFIRSLHAQLLEGVPGADRYSPGQYRPGQVFLGDTRRGFANARFVPPPAGEIAPLMHNLVDYMRRPPAGMPALLGVGIAHYQFEAIHPFADGNGRVGRMLMTLSLCDTPLLSVPLIYPSGYIDQHKQAYYDALLGVSTDGDWQTWLLYFLEAVRSEAEGTHGRMLRLLKLRASYLERVADKSLGHRFMKALDALFASPMVSVASLNDIIAGSPQTARNYIDLMVERGILREWRKFEGRSWYIAHEITSLADEN